MNQRAKDSERIQEAYLDVAKALSVVGNLLRTTEAGKYHWSAEHKTAVSGLNVIVKQLRRAVPDYGQRKYYQERALSRTNAIDSD